jgi:hypothetical protein
MPWKLQASLVGSIGEGTESPRTDPLVLVLFRTFLCQPGVFAWLSRLLRQPVLHRSRPSEWEWVVHIRHASDVRPMVDCRIGIQASFGFYVLARNVSSRFTEVS